MQSVDEPDVVHDRAEVEHLRVVGDAVALGQQRSEVPAAQAVVEQVAPAPPRGPARSRRGTAACRGRRGRHAGCPCSSMWCRSTASGGPASPPKSTWSKYSYHPAAAIAGRSASQPSRRAALPHGEGHVLGAARRLVGEPPAQGLDAPRGERVDALADRADVGGRARRGANASHAGRGVQASIMRYMQRCSRRRRPERQYPNVDFGARAREASRRARDHRDTASPTRRPSTTCSRRRSASPHGRRIPRPGGLPPRRRPATHAHHGNRPARPVPRRVRALRPCGRPAHGSPRPPPHGSDRTRLGPGADGLRALGHGPHPDRAALRRTRCRRLAEPRPPRERARLHARRTSSRRSPSPARRPSPSRAASASRSPRA